MHEDDGTPLDDEMEAATDTQPEPHVRVVKKNNPLALFCCFGCLGVLACVALFFALILIGGFALGVADIKKGYESQSWPTVEGKVTASKIESRTSRTSSTRHSRSRTTTYYHGVVTYDYVVDAKPYSSQRISFKSYGGSREHAEQVVGAYPVGTAVMVHYNPEDPSESVLEPGVGWASFLGPLMWLSPFILILVAVVGLILRFRKRNEAAEIAKSGGGRSRDA